MKSILLLMLVLLCGCEQLTDTGDLPYTKKIVVHFFLSAGEKPEGQITHTVPLNVAYDDSSAAASDAIVTLTVDGKVYSLWESGSFFRSDSLLVEEGKTYSLDVAWQGLRAHAVTTVPFATQLDSAVVDTLITFKDSTLNNATMRYFETSGFFHPLATNAYSIYLGDVADANFEFLSIRGSLYHFSDSGATGRIQSITSNLFTSLPDTTQYYLDLITFSEDYYNFARSFKNQQDNGSFNSSVQNPNWNIEGDAIGYFGAYAHSRRMLHFR